MGCRSVSVLFTGIFISSYFQLDHSTREVELGLECGTPVMNIGGQSWKFEDGQWQTGNEWNGSFHSVSAESFNVSITTTHSIYFVLLTRIWWKHVH